MISVSAFYIALVGLIFLALTVRVIVYRRAHIISLGDNGDKALLKRMRAQANCAEYAPITAILLLALDLMTAPTALLHVLGAAFVIGRLMHAIGFSSTPQRIPLRVYGIALSLITIGVAILSVLVMSFL